MWAPALLTFLFDDERREPDFCKEMSSTHMAQPGEQPGWGGECGHFSYHSLLSPGTWYGGTSRRTMGLEVTRIRV